LGGGRWAGYFPEIERLMVNERNVSPIRHLTQFVTQKARENAKKAEGSQ